MAVAPATAAMTLTTYRTRFGPVGRLTLGAATLLVVCAPALTRGTELDPYVHAFELSYRGVRTLRAEFTETSSAFGRTRQESGRVYLERGGKMRWEYDGPATKLFISDGKELLLYVPGEKQLTRTPLKSSDALQVPLGLLLSRLNLRRMFSKIEFADQGLEPDSGDRVLRAYPRHGYEAEYQNALIELAPNFDIRRLRILYPDGSTMQFTFRRIERNAALAPSLFQFTPPAGTEVIQQ